MRWPPLAIFALSLTANLAALEISRGSSRAQPALLSSSENMRWTRSFGAIYFRSLPLWAFSTDSAVAFLKLSTFPDYGDGELSDEQFAIDYMSRDPKLVVDNRSA